MYSPKESGELIGKSVITLQKWDRKGILKAHRSPTNRRYYTHDQYLTYRGLVAQEHGVTVAYARVSGVAQKPDLAKQAKALEAYCTQHSIRVDEWMQDIGSGLNYKCQQFNRLMEMVELGQVRRVVIAHRDRLVRFGYGYFEAFCERHHTELIVVNGETMSPEQELVQDLLAIVTVFGARLHGLRSYKKVLRDARGNYYASLSYRADPQPAQDGEVIAFDLGVKTLATGVNEQGRVFSIGGFKDSRWYNKQLDKIRSKRDKCKKKSRRYTHLSKAYKRVAEKKRNKHRDSLHKASHLISHKLVERTVVVGDLSQRQMVMKEHQERKKHLNRAIYNDWGLYNFMEMLKYKCQLYGKDLQFVDERNTSKMCSGCGHVQPMPLWKRTYCCTECSLVMDRDENSAHNILMRFLARLAPHTPATECGVLHTNHESVDVLEAPCLAPVQQLELW